MTVQELIDYLEKMPKDASVMIRHELVGDEHDVQSASYDGTTVMLREID